MSQRGKDRSGRGRPNAISAPRDLAKGLARVAGAAGGDPFSAELSAAELGLCADLGVRPLVQVLGACAYTIGVSGAPVLGDPGYREYFGRPRTPGPVMFELRRVSGGYNDARGIALTRMREQAAVAGAHLVVGVRVNLSERETDDLQTVEYVASGTAVRLQDRPAPGAPDLSPLSITDCWVLRQAGFEPVGLAAATVVYYAGPSSATARALGKRGRSAPLNQELPDFSAATTNARDVCQVRMEEQAKRQGGTGLIGVSLELCHSIGFGLRAEGAGSRKQRYANLHLVVHGLGSTIRSVPGAGGRGTHANPRRVIWLQ